MINRLTRSEMRAAGPVRGGRPFFVVAVAAAAAAARPMETGSAKRYSMRLDGAPLRVLELAELVYCFLIIEIRSSVLKLEFV